MSDSLAKLQETIAGYPAWLAIGGAVLFVALVFLLLGKVLRVIGLVMFLVLALAGAWLAWQKMSSGPGEESAPSQEEESPLSG